MEYVFKAFIAAIIVVGWFVFLNNEIQIRDNWHRLSQLPGTTFELDSALLYSSVRFDLILAVAIVGSAGFAAALVGGHLCREAAKEAEKSQRLADSSGRLCREVMDMAEGIKGRNETDDALAVAWTSLVANCLSAGAVMPEGASTTQEPEICVGCMRPPADCTGQFILCRKRIAKLKGEVNDE